MKNTLLAFQVHSFRMLWFGEIFTQTSVNLLNFLLIFFVFSLTKSNTAVSWLVISFTVPTIIFGAIAGVYVDRWEKKKVLIIANVLRAVLLIVLAFFDSNIFMIYFIAFTVALITQFFVPAESPMIPQVVENTILYSANALFSIGLFGSILLAYILAGPALIYLQPFQILLLIALCLIIGAYFISRITLSDAKKVPLKKMSPKKVTEEIRDVLKMIAGKREVYHSLFFLATTQILLLIIAAIAPGYTSEVLKIDINQFPIVFMIPAVLGVVVGAVLISSILHAVSRVKIVNAGLLLSSIAILLMPYGSKIASRDIVQSFNAFLPVFIHISVYDLLTIFAFTLGIANAFVFVPSNTILLESTKEEYRGKIYGILNSLIGILSFIPLLIVGGLSDIVGVGRVISGIGIGIFCVFIGRLLIKW
jgi:MFS family permease